MASRHPQGHVPRILDPAADAESYQTPALATPGGGFDEVCDNLPPFMLDKFASGLVERQNEKEEEEKENDDGAESLNPHVAPQLPQMCNPVAALRYAWACRASSRGSDVRRSVTPLAAERALQAQPGASAARAPAQPQRQVRVLATDVEPLHGPVLPTSSSPPGPASPSQFAPGQPPPTTCLLDGLCAEDVFGDLTDADDDPEEQIACGPLAPSGYPHKGDDPQHDSLQGLDLKDFQSSFDEAQAELPEGRRASSPPIRDCAAPRPHKGLKLRSTQTLTQMLPRRQPRTVHEGPLWCESRARIPSPPPGLTGTALFDWYAQFACPEGHACLITDLPRERQKVYNEQFKFTERPPPQAGAASLGPFGRKGLVKTWLGGETDADKDKDANVDSDAGVEPPADGPRAGTAGSARGRGGGRARGRGRGRGRIKGVHTAREDAQLGADPMAHTLHQWRRRSRGRGGRGSHVGRTRIE